MTMQPPPVPTDRNRSLFDSSYWAPSRTLMKMGIIVALILLLLVPLGMIRSVLDERVERRNAAVAEIGATWGAPQTLVGPLLVVPYKTQVKTWKDQMVNGRSTRIEIEEEKVGRAYFLPEILRIDGEAHPKELYRGIYSAIVYTGRIALEGQFAPPDFGLLNIDPANVLWEEARVSLAVSDLRGVQDALSMLFAGKTYALTPGCLIPGYESGVHARLRDLPSGNEPWPFSVQLNLNGSERIRMAPFGMSTEARWTSSWPDPSFQGAFLPAERSVRSDGFSAEWKISYYGRGYPQRWTDPGPDSAPKASHFHASLFGVEFVQVVDSYRHAERSMKYGILFFVMIFTAFFLFETLMPMRIHPLQYSLTGAALCLFYMALLALSEFIAFAAAYAIGALAATLMIALYSAKALKSGWRAIMIALLLMLVYAFLFVILLLQDYSLLIGTLGLFLALGAVMYATRNIDWYAKDREATSPGSIKNTRSVGTEH